MNNLVTILIPIYNVSAFLRQCLDSVINQTFNNLEIICINDGSTDNSLEILNEYANKDKRIIIIDKKNTGYGDSMNIGFKQISGDYFMIIEPDDWIELDAVENLINSIENNDVLISNKYYMENQDDNKIINYINLIGTLSNSNQNYFDIILHYQYCYTWSRLYKKNIFKENPWINTPKASFQDQYFNYKLLTNKPNIKIIDYSFYHYRIHDNSSIFNNDVAIYTLDYFKTTYNLATIDYHINYWFGLYLNYFTNNNYFIEYFANNWDKYMNWNDLLVFFTSNKFEHDYKIKVLQSLKHSPPNDEYIIISNCKNEQKYIYEWVIYHLNLGFDKIHLFVNDNVEDYSSILNQFQNKIILYDISKLKNFKLWLITLMNKYLSFKWCAFIDCDEFITINGYKNIKEYINSFPEDCEQICLNWLCYGSNGNKKYNPIPIQKRMPFCGIPIESKDYIGTNLVNSHIKSIIKKNNNNPHFHIQNAHFSYHLNTYNNIKQKIQLSSAHTNINYDIAYIKHYYVRDLKDFYFNKLVIRDDGCEPEIERFLRTRYMEHPSLPNQLLQMANYTIEGLDILQNKKILCKNEIKLLPLLKKDLNIIYCGDLKNNNIFINIANYNKCYYNWILPELFDNVYKESDFDLIIE